MLVEKRSCDFVELLNVCKPFDLRTEAVSCEITATVVAVNFTGVVWEGLTR